MRIRLSFMLLFSGLQGFCQGPVDIAIARIHIQLQLPNNKWKPSAETDPTRGVYYYKREPVADAHNRSIVPAIMLFVEDATKNHGDVVEFSAVKLIQFQGKGIKIEQTLIRTDKNYPLTYSNGMFMKSSYTWNGIEHRMYMIHIIDKRNQGIQLYLDLTKELGDQYEAELMTTIRSIREL